MTRPSSPRRGPCRAARSSTAMASSGAATRRTTTASGIGSYTGRRDQPGRRLRVEPLRPGRTRARLRRGAVRAGRRPVARRPAQVRDRPVRPEGPDACRSRGTSSRRRSRRSGDQQGRGRDARSDAPARSSRSPRRRPTTPRPSPIPTTADATFEALRDDADQPLLPRATLGPLRAGLGVQDRHRDRRARLRRGHPATRPTRSSRRRRRTACVVDGFRIRDGHHPQTGDRALDFVEATEVSCNIWYALTGLADRRRATSSTTPARLGFGAPIPFDLPTAVSQVTNGGGSRPADSSTTSSWRTPPTARPRRS